MALLETIPYFVSPSFDVFFFFRNGIGRTLHKLSYFFELGCSSLRTASSILHAYRELSGNIRVGFDLLPLLFLSVFRLLFWMYLPARDPVETSYTLSSPTTPLSPPIECIRWMGICFRDPSAGLPFFNK